LPASLADYLLCPVPFIAGIHSSYLDDIAVGFITMLMSLSFVLLNFNVTECARLSVVVFADLDNDAIFFLCFA
jgi:hypothetical protein